MFEKYRILVLSKAKLTPLKLEKALKSANLPDCQEIFVFKYEPNLGWLFKLVFKENQEIKLRYDNYEALSGESKELAENYASSKMINKIARCKCHIMVFGTDNPNIYMMEKYDSILKIFEGMDGVFIFDSVQKEFY
jgi:hypothetical protein